MDVIVTRNLFELKPHPRNTSIFGDPRRVPEFEEIKRSIRERGLQEPLVIKADGTILSGHLRYQALIEIAAENNQFSHEVEIQVRIHEAFVSEEEELRYLFEANISRRQLTPRQIAMAYSAMLQSIPVEPNQGKGGRPRKEITKHITQRGVGVKKKVARLFQVSARTADSLAMIYQTSGVPADVLELVDTKQISVSLASEAVRYALDMAFHRDPEMTSVCVSPLDVHAYLKYPKDQRAKVSDIIRGSKPEEDPPITVEGLPVPGYFGQVETSNVPPPFTPKQLVKDMIRRGVEYSEMDHLDPGLPLHESVQRIRMRLTEAFTHAHNINEEKTAAALEPLLERTAHYLRSMGKDVTVLSGPQNKKVLPENLYEKLVMFRLALEEDLGECDPTVFRTLLTDIAKTAKDKASGIRMAQRLIPAAPNVSESPGPKKEPLVFTSEIAFITHTLGAETVDLLGA
jgi:ParB-like chromosome segregation protein Spo0J